MGDIAHAAGMSRPTLYYYFEDKQALVLEVLLRQIAEAHDRTRTTLSAADGLSGLPAVLEAAVRGVEGGLRSAHSILLTSDDAERLTALALQSPAAVELEREFWLPLLDAARAAGELRTDIPADELIRWIVFCQFSLVTNGRLFGIADEPEVRSAFERYLLPALSAHPAAVHGET
jgi:AcrR family transcriptional regulator